MPEPAAFEQRHSHERVTLWPNGDGIACHTVSHKHAQPLSGASHYAYPAPGGKAASIGVCFTAFLPCV